MMEDKSLQNEAELMAETMDCLSDDNKDAFKKIYKVLRDVSDDFEADSGYGFDAMDVWVTINGREYYITARKSNKQLKVESN